MCSRYCLTHPPELVRSYFELSAIDDFPPRYNIAPSQPVAIIRGQVRGDALVRQFRLVRWGLIPPWVKDPREFGSLNNARAETASEKPSFRGALRHRRCLIPATGFYEWTGRSSARRPHLIRPRSGGLMGLAGLWEHWLGADGSELETMAILTIPSNPTVAAVHDRMPVVLAPADFATWLDCRSGSASEAIHLLQPVAEAALTVAALDPRLNNPQSEGVDLWLPADDKLL